jgi:large subunit ribosomal protein L3
MPTKSKPHAGSLQFWPRKKARKLLPRVNYKILSGKKDSGLFGFLGYKVGMVSVLVKNNTPDSNTKSKRIVIPGTVIECPEMKIYSVRFYKNGVVQKDVVVSEEKELKRKIKLGKKKELVAPEDYDDLRLVVYSNVKETGIGKKKPDIVEVALGGSKGEKLNFVKENLGKGFSVVDVLKAGELVDSRGTTKGKGYSGPVKRFGISLKFHKSEKGQRRPGSIAPWHPARVTFRTPMAGQLGNFSRIAYNNLIIKVGKIKEDNINPQSGFHKYGNIKNDYVLLKGSVAGSKKKPILLTIPLRPTKKTLKQSFEVVELR